MYYFFYLELALKNPNDSNVYAFINISHIPTLKIAEIFEVDLSKDPFMEYGYILTKKMYRKHKKYIHENICILNLDIFEYSVGISESENPKTIREKYKESFME